MLLMCHVTYTHLGDTRVRTSLHVGEGCAHADQISKGRLVQGKVTTLPSYTALLESEHAAVDDAIF